MSKHRVSNSVGPWSVAASNVPADFCVHPLINVHCLAYVGGAAQEDGLSEAGRGILEDNLPATLAASLPFKVPVEAWAALETRRP